MIGGQMRSMFGMKFEIELAKLQVLFWSKDVSMANQIKSNTKEWKH